jgi:hypothetical protein
MPAYIKAGVYFSRKLDSVRNQTQFYPKNFAYELLVQTGNSDFAHKKYSAACRKFEEAYSIWRYFKTKDNLPLEIVKEHQLDEVDWQGSN